MFEKKVLEQKKLTPFMPFCQNNFPFIEDTINAVDEYQILSAMSGKINEMIAYLNDIIEGKVVDYIDKRFNDIMLDTLYDAETETLIMYLRKEENK